MFAKRHYSSKKKKNQPIPTFFHLPPLSPFTIKPHLPPSFSLKIQNPPIPTPLLISALSQLTSSNFFSFFPYLQSSVSLLFSFSFFLSFTLLSLHAQIYSFLFLSILILFPLFYLWWC